MSTLKSNNIVITNEHQSESSRAPIHGIRLMRSDSSSICSTNSMMSSDEVSLPLPSFVRRGSSTSTMNSSQDSHQQLTFIRPTALITGHESSATSDMPSSSHQASRTTRTQESHISVPVNVTSTM